MTLNFGLHFLDAEITVMNLYAWFTCAEAQPQDIVHALQTELCNLLQILYYDLNLATAYLCGLC